MPEYVVKLTVDGKTETYRGIAPSNEDAVSDAKEKHRGKSIEVKSSSRIDDLNPRSIRSVG